MPKISVIIPIYNVEEYLQRSLNSICNQTLKDIEIICINDGSADNSLKILQEIATNDKRIKVIDLVTNKGVSVARNTGLENSTGEFIGFIDADDYIDPDFYEKLYQTAITENAEITRANAKLTLLDGTTNIIKDEHGFTLPKAKIAFKTMFTLGIYKKSLLDKHQINFPSNYTNGEDLVFFIKAFLNANKVITGVNSYYHYIKRESSASTNGFNDYKPFKWYLKSIYDILMLINKSNFANEDKKVLTDTFLNPALSEFALASATIQQQVKQDLLDIFNNLQSYQLDKNLQNIYTSLRTNKLNEIKSQYDLFQKKVIFNNIRNRIVLNKR